MCGSSGARTGNSQTALRRQISTMCLLLLPKFNLWSSANTMHLVGPMCHTMYGHI